MWGGLTPEQKEVFLRTVANRDVVDLGAGDLTLSKLAATVATSVVAVDKEPMPIVHNILTLRSYFKDFIGEIDTAVLSWPSNYSCGLETLLQRARTVIYLGKCTEGTMCGTPTLWQCLSRREVLQVVPDRANTLIVYGERLEAPRALLQEELAGLFTDETFDHYV